MAPPGIVAGESAPTGGGRLTLGVGGGGGCEWGLGVGWMVELKLNRKKDKIGFQRGGGGCDPQPPLDPPLILIW